MWCFAIVNNRLAEIFFDKGRKVFFLTKDTIDDDHKKGKILSFDSVDELINSLKD